MLGASFLTYKLFHESDSNILLLVSNTYELNKLYNFLSSIIDHERIIIIPSDELVRVEYLSSSKELIAEQIFGINSLIDAKHKIIITTPSMAYRFLPSKELFKNNRITLKLGDRISFNLLREKLIKLGYTRVNKIDASLQFSIRGDIIDIFSLNYQNPIRIEFFDDDIESIRFFDISSQTSYEQVNSITILPASLNLLYDDEILNAKEKILNQFERDKDHLTQLQKEQIEAAILDDIEEISNGFLTSKNYKYFGFLQGFHTQLADYLNDHIVITTNENEFLKSSSILFDEARMFLDDLHQGGKTISHLSYYQNTIDIYSGAKNIYILNTFYIHRNSISIDIKNPFLGTSKERNTLAIIKSYSDLKYKLFLIVSNQQQIDSLKLCLDELHLNFSISDNLEIDEEKDIIISVGKISSGYQLESEKIAVLTSYELFGYKKKKSAYSSKFKEGVILGSYLELERGDYVVHEFNGIGQFIGITTLEVHGRHEDYLEILYAKGDKVYVPLYQFNLIRKYVGKDGKIPSLSNLSTEKWTKTKERVKEKVNDLALRLLDLYQSRKKIDGFSFNRDDEIQEEFEARFDHDLTKDQLKSLNEIKNDMESTIPMDRLLCGDVGFGKTEVAFRAAMKAILSGKQVCFLCPTTLLSKQHYEVSLERFEGFGVRIALLSRLKSEKENNDTISGVESGEIHLVIGTHKLLNDKVKFKNLGLLIIDEEQRFGVEQKEKIKEKTRSIDCLTLSATPIPRTLQSTLIGLKNVSTIETPPNERMPIQTYVVPYDEGVIKELIKRELSRNGQIFYVFNSIDRIYEKARRLELLVPECKIGIIHGKMEKDDVDDIMDDFYKGNLDLLLATTIIENGIDVRNANLILIENADHFGLAQLYQIKGRVGRGDRMAFAYLMINNYKTLTEQSKQRLKSIQDFTELGSGYKIAQRDLLIRGAGDILGPQQAGFIDEVGIDMYLRLLNEAIEENKTGNKNINKIESISNLNIDAYIPSSYASDTDKVELYQKILECHDIYKLNELRNYMRDMYGKIPLNTEYLIKKRKIDIYLSNKHCFEKCIENIKNTTLTLSNEFANINNIGSSLFTSLITLTNKINITYKNKVLAIEISKQEGRTDTLLKVMEIVIKLYNSYIKVEELNYENR